MYRKIKSTTSNLGGIKTYVGETIEEKIQRIVNNKEPITDGAPLIYTERKDGVQAAYDVRTDRFEIAIEAMDKVQKANVAKREARYKKSDSNEVKTDTKVIDMKGDNPGTGANTSDNQ